MAELETTSYSLLFVYKEGTGIHISTYSKNRGQFSSVMFLAAASLLGPVQGELLGFFSPASLLGSEYKSILLNAYSFLCLTV